MPIEREIKLRVDEASMPNLEGYPVIDIEQIYLTPHSSAEYPEANQVEWRVRRATSMSGESVWTSTMKVGDKNSGMRIELETEVSDSAFGTKRYMEDFAFACLKKKRYVLGNGLVVDQFQTDAKPGAEYQAEKEFNGLESVEHWGCPSWLSPDQTLPNNRERAIERQPRLANGIVNKEAIGLNQLIHDLTNAARPMAVSVSGMSGSGKSTIAKYISFKLDAAHIDTDMFHIGATALMKRNGGVVNHDLLMTYDYEGAADAARQLIEGSSVRLPIYDYETSERLTETKEVMPTASGYVVLDGLYSQESLAAMSKREKDINLISINIDTPVYVSVIRRMIRDCSLKGEGDVERKVSYSPEETLKYLAEIALPTYLEASKTFKYDYVIR